MLHAAFAVSPYPALKIKAERAFRYGEWPSAAAMFDLMLEERPEVPQTYGQAIVANAMCGNTGHTSVLMAKALDNHIPFDTVFSSVRTWSFHIGHPTLFEDFLKENRSAHPWMRRTINAYLLKYYAFRQNGAAMIDYARQMLESAPDNIPFMKVLAEGYMLTGDFASGMAVYERILAYDPDNYNALLCLGNWNAMHRGDSPDRATAAAYYLGRAYALRPTPHVAALLKKL